MAITARLLDVPANTPAEILRDAEARFLRELERLLGDDLGSTFRAFDSAQDSSAQDLTKEEIRMASRWAAAFDKARLAGMRELGGTGEAYFHVRVDK